MSLKPKQLRTTFPEGTGLALIAAPWRHKYFDHPREEGCFICRAAANPPLDRQNLVLLRGEHALVLLNRYPYTMGALLVAPIAHLPDLRDLDDATSLELTQLAKEGLSIVEAALKPRGFNLGINQGADAGAGLDGHIHMHIVPRWPADTNFMTVTAGARVLAEDVNGMYRRLKRAKVKLEKVSR